LFSGIGNIQGADQPECGTIRRFDSLLLPFARKSLAFPLRPPFGRIFAMTIKKTTLDKDKMDQFIAEVKRNQQLKEATYRERAIKMYPWICGRCAREFTSRNLSELTVHHKDHNHDNNPPDGSNWELLCVYCHDNEHSRYEEMRFGSASALKTSSPAATHNPFAGLKELMTKK
jgi:hypothetical protein